MSGIQTDNELDRRALKSRLKWKERWFRMTRKPFKHNGICGCDSIDSGLFLIGRLISGAKMGERMTLQTG